MFQEGERRMQSLKSADEEELRRLQQQLQQLQQERDELQRKANDKTKLTQLEEQLAGMRRRVQESERALRPSPFVPHAERTRPSKHARRALV